MAIVNLRKTVWKLLLMNIIGRHPVNQTWIAGNGVLIAHDTVSEYKTLPELV